jgi:Tfp pilus assembly protein PilV
VQERTWSRLHRIWSAVKAATTPANVVGVLLSVVLLVIVWLSYLGFATQAALERETARNMRSTEQNRRALCAIRHEREQDEKIAQNFLDDHPEAIIQIGDLKIPRAQFETDLRNAREIIAATDHLSCPKNEDE